MSWISRYRLKLYLNNSIWILPLRGIIVGLVSVEIDEDEQSSNEHVARIFHAGSISD